MFDSWNWVRFAELQQLPGFRTCMAAILNVVFRSYLGLNCRYLRQIRYSYRLLYANIEVFEKFNMMICGTAVALVRPQYARVRECHMNIQRQGNCLHAILCDVANGDYIS